MRRTLSSGLPFSGSDVYVTWILSAISAPDALYVSALFTNPGDSWIIPAKKLVAFMQVTTQYFNPS